MNYKNPYTGYPYVPRMAMPPQMQTPEQYKADLLRQLQPNLDMYNQQYSAYQQQQNYMANSGQYVKVQSYEEVKNVQAPSDGRPIIIIDEINGFLYSKKFENGQEYIKPFRLVPQEAKEEVKEEKSVLDQIMARLDKLEGKDNGVSRPTDEKTPDAKSTSV